MALEKKYNKFPKITHKVLFHKKLFFILGFLGPIPLFINFQNLSLILVKFNQAIAYRGINGDIPIPIGFIANAIFILLLIKKRNNLSVFIKSILFLISIFILVYYKFGFIRVFAILSPFIFLIGFQKIISKPDKDLIAYIYGYLLGILSFFSVVLVSFLSSSLINYLNIEVLLESDIIRNINSINLNFARQVFNIEIYQYYISVSAVISLIIGTLILMKINIEYKNKFINNLLKIIIILSLIISSTTLRKTTILELIILAFLIFINKILNKRVQIWFWQMLTLSFSYLNFFLITNTRISAINIKQMLQERPYFKFLKDAFYNKSFSDILFGSTPGFGDYSNIFLELLFRSGLVGLFLYITLLSIILKKIYSQFSNKIHLRLIIIFILSNLLIGNLLNLNLTQPYYVCNLFSVLLFSYLLSKQEIIEYKNSLEKRKNPLLKNRI